MAQSVLVNSQKAATAAIAAATLATVPPAKVDMVAVTGMRTGNGKGHAQRLARLMLKGGQAGAQTLSAGAVVWGWDVEEDKPVKIGLVNDGFDAVFTNAYFFAQLLADALGCYSHIGITGTLSASTVIIEVAPVETVEE